VGIAQISGNGLASALMAALRDALRQAMVTAFERLEDPSGTMKALAAEHELIIDAIADGDGDAAADLVARHILGFYHTLGFRDLSWAG
jgi:DNA-binding FadR family transcriptional regulator